MLISYLPSFACRRMILGGVRRVGGKKSRGEGRRVGGKKIEEGGGGKKGEGRGEGRGGDQLHTTIMMRFVSAR